MSLTPGFGTSEIDPLTGLPYGMIPPPPTNYLDPGAVSPIFSGGTKVPGGGYAAPTGNLDPITGTFTTTPQTAGAQIVPDPISGAVAPTTAQPTTDWTQTPPPPGFHWANGVLVQDAAGAAPEPPQPPPPPPPPPPPLPPEVPPVQPIADPTPFVPQPPEPLLPNEGLPVGPVGGGYSQAGGSQTGAGFAGPRGPQGEGFRPSAPLWARGLQRSPFAKFMSNSAQGAALFGGFGMDAAPVDPEELRRRQEMAAQMPQWAMGA